MTPEDAEKTEIFKIMTAKLRKKFVREAVNEITGDWKGKEFTRTHIVSSIEVRELCAPRELQALDESVRAEVHKLLREGVLHKTGERKFGRDIYTRISK